MVPPLPNGIRPSIVRSFMARFELQCGTSWPQRKVESSFLRMRTLALGTLWLRFWTPNTLLHRFPLLPLSLLILPHLISLIWISPQIWLNRLPIGSMVPQVWGVLMLMLSHIGSHGMVKPASLHAIVAHFACWLANAFPPRQPTEPS